MNNKYVFISYSRENTEEVKKIANELIDKGQAVWIDYKDIPAGKTWAEEIVKGISDSTCVILMLSENSNNSQMVLNEVNSATNHNKKIIPLMIHDPIKLSSAMEFYVSRINWFCYKDSNSLDKLLESIKLIQDENKNTTYKYPGPIVLHDEEIKQIGYDTRRKVIETIEIDYLTLGPGLLEYEINSEYLIDSQIEGDPNDWLEYCTNYPETASFLIVNDRIVGYFQVELINENNYTSILNGEKMITGDMEEPYLFGGEFFSYIAIMPIIPQYENQNNYLLLIDALFKKFIYFYKEFNVEIKEIGISVYSHQLEKILKILGFEFVGKNPAKGNIYKLTKDNILSNKIYQNKYPTFYNIIKGE